MSGKIRKVVIPAAGLGTRGLPFTKEVPKELIPVIDIPALNFIVDECVEAGIEEVIFVTSKGKSAMEDYFDPSPALESYLRSKGKNDLADRIHKIGTMVNVLSVRQKEAKGLGHAVLCAKPLLNNEPFAVCLGDEIFAPWAPQGRHGLKRLVDVAEKSQSSVIGVMQVPREETKFYGIIDTADKALAPGLAVPVRRTVEKPQPEAAPSLNAIIGRYVFQSEILEALEGVTAGVSGEIQLTDALDTLASRGRLQAMLFEDRRYDLGNPLYYVLSQVDSALHRPELAARLRPLLLSLLEQR